MQAAGLFKDDSQIDYLGVTRAVKTEGGMVTVQIAERRCPDKLEPKNNIVNNKEDNIGIDR